MWLGQTHEAASQKPKWNLNLVWLLVELVVWTNSLTHPIKEKPARVWL